MSSSAPDPLVATLWSYDQGAAEYAAHSRDRTPLAHLHARFAGLSGQNGLVLDLGCGPAHDAAELAQRGLRVIGLDASRRLVIEARSHQVLSGRLILGDARETPFSPGRFDGIWACASLLHIEKSDVPLALAEAFRILRPGGVLFTSMQHGSGEMVPYDPGFGFPLRHYFFYLASEWETLLRMAGFEVIDQRVNPTSHGLTPGASGWIETFARSSGARAEAAG